MCLFGEEEDFGKINSLYFLNLKFLGNFRFLKFENQESGKNSPEILGTFFKPEKSFSKVINKKSNSNTRV